MSTLNDFLFMKFQKQRLSPRQIDIAVMIVYGKSNKQIAESLNSKEKMVKQHVTEIYRKTKNNNRSLFISKCFLNYLSESKIFVSLNPGFIVK